MFELGDVLSIVGILFGLGVQAILVVNWMNTKFEQYRDIVDKKHAQSDNAIDILHSRINTVKDEYVKKVDLDKDLMTMQNSLSTIRTDIHHQTKEMNSRLDRLVKILLDNKYGANSE